MGSDGKINEGPDWSRASSPDPRIKRRRPDEWGDADDDLYAPQSARRLPDPEHEYWQRDAEWADLAQRQQERPIRRVRSNRG